MAPNRINMPKTAIMVIVLKVKGNGVLFIQLICAMCNIVQINLQHTLFLEAIKRCDATIFNLRFKQLLYIDRL